MLRGAATCAANRKPANIQRPHYGRPSPPQNQRIKRRSDAQNLCHIWSYAVEIPIPRVIRMLADRGDMAILLVEQYYDFAQELADHYVVMERGAVVASGLGKDMEANGVRKLVAI